MRTPASFQHVLASGERRRAGDLTVVRAEGEPGSVRYGLVAGKRVGTAVSRNRAKRRLRRAISSAGLEPGFDYVVIAGESTAHVGFATLIEWLRQAGGAAGAGS
ncbi:MAG TPA: ribonuclease P protein component [Acidimicrobiia bacterium]